jgi:hypothetical protein
MTTVIISNRHADHVSVVDARGTMTILGPGSAGEFPFPLQVFGGSATADTEPAQPAPADPDGEPEPVDASPSSTEPVNHF